MGAIDEDGARRAGFDPESRRDAPRVGTIGGGDPVIRRLASVLLAGALAVALLPIGACRHARQSTPQATAATLPVVRPDSDDLLLTWIDDKGDFHVETRASDVPLMGRDTV